MNTGTILCCALAALAGWCSVTLWEHREKSGAASAAPPPPATVPVAAGSTTRDALQKFRQAGPGSAEISRMAAFLAAVPNDSLEEFIREVNSWPRSTARQFALALLTRRNALAQDPLADPSAPPGPAAEPPGNAFSGLEREMAEGHISLEPGSGGQGFHSQALADWVSADPAAATAAILKMPRGTGYGARSDALNYAAGVIALTDPAAALELVLQGGERNLRYGSAEAWAKLVTGAVPSPTAGPSAGDFLNRMSREQQDSMFDTLANMLHDFDDTNINTHTSAGGSDLTALARAVLQTKGSSPGLEAFFQALAEDHPRAREEVLRFIESSDLTGPAAFTAMEILCAARAEELVESGFSTGMAPHFASGSWKDNPHPASPAGDVLLNRTASAMAATLTSTGRLPEALQLLESLTDSAAHRDTTLSLLPAWMDSDPIAARTAFQALPLTALERERGEHHPSFLLNTAPKP